jgi:hypothetical protein
MTASDGLVVIMAVVIFIIISQVIWRRIISYRLTNSAVTVEFLKLKVFSIRYLDMKEIRLSTFGECFSPWAGWLFANRIFFDTAVSIKKRRFGFFQKIIITPDDPERFFSEISERVDAALDKQRLDQQGKAVHAATSS